MDSPASSRCTAEDSYAGIIKELLAIDQIDLAQAVVQVFARHRGLSGRRLAAALRSAADEADEGGRGTARLRIAALLEDAADEEESALPTPEQCAFVHQLLMPFARANSAAEIETATARLFVELRQHPELTGPGLSNAVREMARLHGKKTAGLPPAPVRIIATLGIAVLAHRFRRGMRAIQASAFTRLGRALAQFPGSSNRVALREAAVASCRAGLGLLLPEARPDQQAEALNTMGIVALARESSDREANRREAVAHYRAALRILENEPSLRVQWAWTQSNLAGALNEMTSVDQRVAQEEALAALAAALGVLDLRENREAYRDEWARVQMVLGFVLIERIDDDRRQNLSNALAALYRAMGVWIDQNRFEELAETMNALGIAFMELDAREPLQHAVDSVTQALTVLTRETHPAEWAVAQSNLGVAWLRLAGHLEDPERLKTVDAAIAAFQDAGEVLDERGLAYWAAHTKVNLGGAYLGRAHEKTGDEQGIQDARIDRIIELGIEAESVFTPYAFPRRWAATRQMIGSAFLLRQDTGGPGSSDEERGLAAIAQGLEVLDPAVFPHDALPAGRTLGDAASTRGRWDLAVTGYGRAVQAAEQLRRQATAEARRDEIVTAASDAHAGLVRALVRTCHPAEALAAAERAKARQLSELLAEQNLRASAAVPRAQVEVLGRARAAELSAVRLFMAASVRQENSGALLLTEDSASVRQEPLAEYRAEVEAAQDAVARALAAIQAHDPAFALAQAESPPPTPDELRALLPDENTALLSLYMGDTVYAFVLTSGGVHAEAATAEELLGLGDPLDAYLAEPATAPEDIAWRLGTLFGALGVVSRALGTLPEQIDRLLLIPHRRLHLLPLHALQTPDGALIDRFPRGVVYAPSARLLGLAQGRNRRAFDSLLAVRPDAVPPLPATCLEVGLVADNFSLSRRLDGQEATKSALAGRLGPHPNEPTLANAHAIHFACHGRFDHENPLASALVLEDEERLTLAEVFALELDGCRLAVLSACGTGRISVADTEEYVGLPAAFLYAGSSAVVSTLWSVADVSTALLSARLYESLRENGDPCAPYAVAEALAEAQRWLRDSTVAELEAWLKERRPDEFEEWKMELRSPPSRRRNAAGEEWGEWILNERLFAEPFYWAPFIATGC